MTNTQLRIAVALTQGFRRVHYKGGKSDVLQLTSDKRRKFVPLTGVDPDDDNLDANGVPNYPEDLNAIDEACRKMGHAFTVRFCEELRSACVNACGPIFAPARQCSITFIRTYGNL